MPRMPEMRMPEVQMPSMSAFDVPKFPEKRGDANARNADDNNGGKNATNNNYARVRASWKSPPPPPPAPVAKISGMMQMPKMPKMEPLPKMPSMPEFAIPKLESPKMPKLPERPRGKTTTTPGSANDANGNNNNSVVKTNYSRVQASWKTPAPAPTATDGNGNYFPKLELSKISLPDLSSLGLPDASISVKTYNDEVLRLSSEIDERIKSKVNAFTGKSKYEVGDITKAIISKVANEEFELSEVTFFFRVLIALGVDLSGFSAVLPVAGLVGLLGWGVSMGLAERFTQFVALEINNRVIDVKTRRRRRCAAATRGTAVQPGGPDQVRAVGLHGKVVLRRGRPGDKRCKLERAAGIGGVFVHGKGSHRKTRSDTRTTTTRVATSLYLFTFSQLDNMIE